MTDSTNPPTEKLWILKEDGSTEFLPFGEPEGDSELMPIDLDDELLEQLGIDLETDEGRDRMSMLFRDAIQGAIDKYDQAKEDFDEWSSRFDHDSDKWEDMGRDECFIAGRLYDPRTKS